MPAKKSGRKVVATATGAVSVPARVPSMRIPAVVAGAARRRKARRAVEKTKAGQRVNWAKAARQVKNVSKDDVKKVLDKGVSKADQLLESAMKWVVKLAIRAKALYDMLDAWWHGKHDFPTGTLQAMLVALLYFLSPLDIIPDVLPFFGLIDDAAVFAFVVNRIKADLEAYAEATGKSPSDLGL